MSSSRPGLRDPRRAARDRPPRRPAEDAAQRTPRTFSTAIAPMMVLTPATTKSTE